MNRILICLQLLVHDEKRFKIDNRKSSLWFQLHYAARKINNVSNFLEKMAKLLIF